MSDLLNEERLLALETIRQIATSDAVAIENTILNASTDVMLQLQTPRTVRIMSLYFMTALTEIIIEKCSEDEKFKKDLVGRFDSKLEYYIARLKQEVDKEKKGE